jgi:hypothetical protein
MCVLIAVIGTASSPAGRESGDGTAKSVVGAPKLERTPDYVLAQCRASKRLRLACPHLLPRMVQPPPHWEMSVCLVGHPGCLGLTWDDLDLVDAGYGDHPPVWSHVSVYAGDLSGAFRFRYPTHGDRDAHLDGLFAKAHTRAIYVGAYTWGGRHGTVVLAPDFPGGGEQGGHLIFRWRQAGVGCAIGLHGWEPLAQTFVMLRAIVRSV